MNATQYRELTADDWLHMWEGVQRVIQPYMRRKLDVMQLTVPTMTITRTADGVTMTTSYPPDVQEHFDRCDSMCREAVAQYLRQEGYTLPDAGL
ncbi:hypothetical protein HX794_07780 [Pseudomonas costantinii]|uniref:hypothetical protein n=1 Tax=Pseudomonas costantinii TaxID=168469 RepID=UPI0015A39561|nr:hypothetical protein [Pseudomonas costantinii]NVZ19535.1 hypothetical protein [Pseudomonas costantinii]